MPEFETTYEHATDAQKRSVAEQLLPEVATFATSAVAAADGTAKGPNGHSGNLAKRKPGAQSGNRSNYRHGLRSPRSPEGATYLDVASDQLRRNLEDLMIRTKGSIGFADALRINSLCRHEQSAQKLFAFLRSQAGEALSIPEKCRLLVDASNLTDRRDRAARDLNLDADPQFKPWLIPATAQDAPQRDVAPDGPEAGQNGHRATAGGFETHGGDNA
jgi:hypothetical protein